MVTEAGVDGVNCDSLGHVRQPATMYMFQTQEPVPLFYHAGLRHFKGNEGHV